MNGCLAHKVTASILFATLSTAAALESPEDKPIPRPGRVDVAAKEQYAWLDQNLPKLVAEMERSKDVRDKICGPLALEGTFSYPPQAVGAANEPDRTAPITDLIDKCVNLNDHFGRNARPRPPGALMILPKSKIAWVQMVHPPPPVVGNLEVGPLVFDAWICPDRLTAIALFWLRKGGFRFLDPDPLDSLRKSVLELDEDHFGTLIGKNHPGEKNPGEIAFWTSPREAMSQFVYKTDKNVPFDRLMFLRGNVIAEASTVEFTYKEEFKKRWLALRLNTCVPDVLSIMRSVDAGLVKLGEK